MSVSGVAKRGSAHGTQPLNALPKPLGARSKRQDHALPPTETRRADGRSRHGGPVSLPKDEALDAP